MNTNTESFNMITSTVSTSLDKTQKNSLNTDSATEQILALSGHGQHEDIVNTVLNCTDMDTEKKIRTIRELNSEHHQRVGDNFSRYEGLQRSQTQNVQASTKTWGDTLIIVVPVVCVCVFCFFGIRTFFPFSPAAGIAA